MDLRLITVAFDPDTGGFPEQPLKDVEGEIVNVVEHFFHHLQQPHLLLVVHVRPPADERRQPHHPSVLLRRGTEAPRPGSGLHKSGMAAGPPFDGDGSQ